LSHRSLRFNKKKIAPKYQREKVANQVRIQEAARNKKLVHNEYDFMKHFYEFRRKRLYLIKEKLLLLREAKF
jgi:hypothetical protein